eukprot:CAMPEP_0178722842 /NCGR_PEP_ID=MMETSP0699-20121125/25215_1 /TAXON_ID=265572 /ORGANISM="Extubocellulus spinifer, Strain CCMP396" /LENGTH=49 /DNA_ID=CAMNT_0020373855 /DNA_START=112 /DNA_END=261 /DNA_ORIENTATION=-
MALDSSVRASQYLAYAILDLVTTRKDTIMDMNVCPLSEKVKSMPFSCLR